MKKLFILSVILALCIGCATSPPQCPPTDVVIRTDCGPMGMDKGTLDEEHRDEHWMTMEEWTKRLEELRKREGL